MATIQPSFFGEFFFEREAIFNNNDCKVGECEVIELEFSRRQKRFTDSRISFPLKAFGRRRTLNLRPSSGVIIGSNTPVYFAYSNTNIQRGNIQMLSTLFRSQFYEDEENLAAFTLDVDSEGPKIKYGIVRPENLTITPLNPPTNSSESSPRQYYLAKSTFIFTGFPPSQQRTTPVPAQLYPEILLVVDYDLLIIHQNSILQHLINFWNQVNVLFQPIENPRFQLSIAGIVIPVNPQAFVFPNTYGIISYDNALVYLSDWLQNAQNAIPFNSYDVHMLMTPHNDVNPNVGGSTHMGSACSGLRYGKPLGGLIRDNDDSELSKIINGAHELGHALGLPHDNQIGEEAIPSYLMMSSFNPSQKWSYDSKKKMQQSMQSQDFSCLDNYPQVASSPPKILSPDNNNNGVYNHQPPITNRTPRPHNNNKPNGENDRVLLRKINDGNIYSFYPSHIPSGKLVTIVHLDIYSVIGIFYHDPPASEIHYTRGENFFISVSDNQIITLDPSIMSPIKIHVTHMSNHIYAFQSSTYVQDPY